MGVDFGSRTIGIAVGEVEFGLASPRSALAASGTLKQDAAALFRLARREEVDVIALGLPLLPTGEDTRASGVVRKLSAELSALGARVILVNEAYSTSEAHENLKEASQSAAQRKRGIDSESACVILQRYFSEHA